MVPAMEHYRFYMLYANKTRAEHISDTVVFFPEHNKIPGVSSQESAANAALDLIKTIADISLKAPFSSIGATKLQSISNLADIFKQKT